MIPLYLLIASFIAFLLLGREGVVYFHVWQHALRAALGAMFLLTASAHWGKRRADLIAMVPIAFPRPTLLVTLTGILETIGAVALQIPKLAFFTATGLFLMLIAVFPANIYAARHRLKIAGQPVPGLLTRSIIQVIFLVALWFAGAPAQ
jgi:uncharacterized membrane protein